MSENKISFEEAAQVIRDLQATRCSLIYGNSKLDIMPGKVSLISGNSTSWYYVDRDSKRSLFDTIISLGGHLQPFSGIDVSDAIPDLVVKGYITIPDRGVYEFDLNDRRLTYLDSRSLCTVPILTCVAEYSVMNPCFCNMVAFIADDGTIKFATAASRFDIV